MLTVPLMALLQGWQPPPVEYQPSLNLRSRFSVMDEVPVVGARARVGLEARRLGVGAKVSLQVVREWLQQYGPVVASGDDDSVLAEGWISIHGALSDNIVADLKVGRQPVRLDDGRLVGEDDFSLGGRFLDALRADVELAPMHLRFLNARRFDDPASDPLGLGVNILAIGAGREVASVEWLVDGVLVVDARYSLQTSNTVGVFSRLNVGRLSTRGEAYLQGAGEGVGGLASLQAGWTFGRFEGFQLDGALDLATGEGGGWATWRPVLGDRHTFWGRLDVFADPQSYADGGLGDLRLGMGSRILPAVKLRGELHRFWAPAGGGRGSEADLDLEWALSPMVAVRGGGGYLLADPDGENHSLGWVELDATF